MQWNYIVDKKDTDVFDTKCFLFCMLIVLRAPPLSASEISFVSFSYPKMSFSRKRIKTRP